ncbi:MAG: PA14 domain-containing protein [Phycisphaerae bacterium]
MRIASCVGVSVLSILLAACATAPAPTVKPSSNAGFVPPLPLAPEGSPSRTGGGAIPADAIDLTKPGAVVRRTVAAQVLDTRRMVDTSEKADKTPITTRRIRTMLPDHPSAPIPPSDAMDVVQQQGSMTEQPMTMPGQLWTGVTATGWNPPDPTLAVGPNHVVVTVNQTIAFYNRAGARSFITDLGSPGNPGFFEPLGSLNFVFDPKCFYDHLAQRFVVVAFETYGTTESWVTIAVSDDSDPNGTWYKYRTQGVITSGTQTYWWDYPGFGYDAQGYYVTGNLFGLNASGFGGAAYRVFDKTPMLTGQPVVFSTLRDTGASSVQIAEHMGVTTNANAGVYFVSFASSTAIRLQAITSPLTAPTLQTVNVTIPAYASAPSAATTDPSTPLNVIDPRVMNAMWRNGRLVLAHSVGVGGRSFARWYEVNTSSWPVSGTPTLVQSGDVDPGGAMHSFFPAVALNGAGQIGMVLGVSGPGTNPAVAVAARGPSDVAGRMSLPLIVQAGSSPAGGRWGDYYGIQVDPTNDAVFWGIGQYKTSSGAWATNVSNFTLATIPNVQAASDVAGIFQGVSPRDIDVLANDFTRDGTSLTISAFAATSTRGGTITRLVGAGPGGRDLLRYSPPANFTGNDSFTYTARDTAGGTATAIVTSEVFDPADYLGPNSTGGIRPALDVRYYVENNPQGLGAYDQMTPYLTTSVATINFPSTSGNFSTSGRADNVAAVYEGYFLAQASDLYTFFLESDDGSRMFIGTNVFVENDGLHGMIERNNRIGLQPGYHKIRIEFFEAGGGAGLIFRYQRTGVAKQVVPAALLWRVVPCNDIDFNNNGVFPEDADVIDFFSVLAGSDCAACDDIDFNNDGVFPSDQDVEAFFRVLSGGTCEP